MKCMTRLLFISLISWSAIIFYGCEGDTEVEAQNGITSAFEVSGMTCQGCATALEGALHKSKHPLIHSAKADFNTKTCKVVHDKKMSVQDIEKAINSTPKFRVVRVIK
ncbi:MAG TPA: heavy metal-associated domain-containing protein [Myxococcota bacterium]|nr:heavy metal-associated domain-containing protein [Myxococcota bacterium]